MVNPVLQHAPAAQRAVVVGAAGFVGRRLAAALLRAEVATACLTRQSRFLLKDDLAHPLHQADIVFYLASSINPALGEKHPEWAAADHRLFSTLLDRLSGFREPPTVVLTSSGGTVYDPDCPAPYAESDPLRPSGSYGAAKLALERELLDHADRVPAVVLRLSNVYGPGQAVGTGQGVLAYWLAAAARGEPLQLIGDPDNTRDYVYVDDVVDALCLLRSPAGRAAVAPGSPLVLNIGSGERTSLAELARVVQDVVGARLPVRTRPGRPFDRGHVWLDVRRAGRTLGWRPRTSLPDGVAAAWRATARPLSAR
ncbi:NAD-dependent epimerase/dehydratase family protein [Actinokineospora enzanensis]|uniref:NAD-dependent epimerase/dehydratase family protein n=1 Tax=Actinokineospora enzanensis TaxID=155975 RepID=UPI0003A76F90|nr:NAD-dependent epimerase/dehydratase family protein [Actinokineospora enzanensis]